VRVADGAFLRVYGKARYSDTGKYLSFDESTNDAFFEIGSNADDEGTQSQGGFRLDWYKDSNNEITLQGDGYGGRYYDTRLVGIPASASRNRINVAGGNLLGRWLHRYASGSESTFRVYWDYTYRSDDAFRERRHTADFDWQHRLEIEAGDSWIPAQRFSWGAGARLTLDDTDQVAAFFLDPQNRTSPMGSAFLQDRIALVAERLFAIVGTKWEHNDFSGSEFQPSGRLLWTPDKRTTAWLAVSYPARTPNRVDSDGRILVGGVEIPTGDPDTERLVAYEVGYRVQLGKKVAVDLAAFYDDWRHVTTKRLWGVEVEAQASLSPSIGVEASYTYHDGRESDGGGGARRIGRLNQHLAHFSATWDPAEAITINTDLFYVSRARTRDSSGVVELEVPAYVRWDVRAAWRPHPGWEFAVAGTNLTESEHPEDIDRTRVNTGVSRGVLVSLTYDFD
jgi:iron complex outermembrane receptor protein